MDDRQLAPGILQKVLEDHLLWLDPNDAEIKLSSDEKCAAYCYEFSFLYIYLIHVSTTYAILPLLTCLVYLCAVTPFSPCYMFHSLSAVFYYLYSNTLPSPCYMFH